MVSLEGVLHGVADGCNERMGGQCNEGWFQELEKGRTAVLEKLWWLSTHSVLFGTPQLSDRREELETMPAAGRESDSGQKDQAGKFASRVCSPAV